MELQTQWIPDTTLCHLKIWICVPIQPPWAPIGHWVMNTKHLQLSQYHIAICNIGNIHAVHDVYLKLSVLCMQKQQH